MRAVTGETRVAGLIGYPARHSLSPTILNAAFAARELDWTFLVFEVPEPAGAEAVAGMRALGIGGLSVTMPHKAVASASVDRRTPVAEALEAVNCIFWDGDRLVGDNTDAAGFLDALRSDHGVDVAGRRCVLVGAGGAGRAVAWALGRAGAAEVVVVNRSRHRAEWAARLAGEVGRVGGAGDVPRADLLVNATPLGMGGSGPEALSIDPDAVHPGQVVVDLIYHPPTTPLLAAAAGRGAQVVNGLGMLVHQAAHAFRHWTADEPPLAMMAEAARSELERRGQSPADSTGVHPTVQPDGKDP